MAIALPSKRLTISSGIGLAVDVHHTWPYVVLMGPWYTSKSAREERHAHPTDFNQSLQSSRALSQL